ncbi:MAG TPA: redoxin domain-containing protein [Planctomycetes bacterium]|nr:redoxin domain-containing protein [Fuerstiella sp.]HIK94359.1 redoxin domain-containing protein [Planctomycetota bacterium]
MRQLVQLQKQADEFKALNTEMIFVFREEQSGVDGLKKIKEKTKTGFTLTLDPDKKSTNVYSTKRMTFDNFVIDRKGNVQAIIDGTLRDRATAVELLKVLRKIEG